MKKAIFVTALFSGSFLWGGRACGQVNSSTTVDSITVVKMGMAWKVTVTGKITLGTNDSFGGVKFSFLDPNGGNPAPTIQNFTIPMPGQTQPYTVYIMTMLQGNWNFTAWEFYMDGMVPGSTSTGKKFTVP